MVDMKLIPSVHSALSDEQWRQGRLDELLAAADPHVNAGIKFILNFVFTTPTRRLQLWTYYFLPLKILQFDFFNKIN